MGRAHSDGRRLAEAVSCSRTTALHFIRGGASKDPAQRVELAKAAQRLGIKVTSPVGAEQYAPKPKAPRARATEAARHFAEVAFVLTRELVSWSSVIAALEVDEERGHADLLALLKSKRLFGRRIDGVYMVTRDPAKLPPINLTLPMLQVGAGDRRDDCRHANDCLSRLVVARPKVTACHCPTDCTQYAPIERHERVGASMLGGISSLGMAQELIAETGEVE